MRFRLITVAYVFALLAAGMALFGLTGVFVSSAVLLFWMLLLIAPLAGLWRTLAMVLLFGLIAVALIPAMGTAHNAALRNICLNNMKQIMLALEVYRTEHGTYPPAYIADAQGRPMHSWRVLILPYMEHEYLYEDYDFDEPWDGPNNRKLWSRMPEVYACPEGVRWRQLGGSHGTPADNVANYVAVVGESTAWPGGRARTSSELADPSKVTLVVLEYSGGTQPWTAPVDLSEDEAIDLLAAHEARGHLHTSDRFFTATCSSMLYLGGFSDAHAKALWPGMPRDVAKSMLTVDGGEDCIPWDEVESGRRLESPILSTMVRWDRVYGMTVFALLAALPGAVRISRRGRS